MIISLSGLPGAGKSTVGQMLAEKLKMKRYYMGAIRRQKAAERGLTLDEYNKLGETDPTTDTAVEEYVKHLGETEDNFIIESRTAWHFIPRSIKIFLTVAPEESARRIVGHLKEKGSNRNEQNYQTVKEAITGLAARLKSDRERFQKYYNLDDIYDTRNFDLVIDTTNLTPEQVAEKIMLSFPSVPVSFPRRRESKH